MIKQLLKGTEKYKKQIILTPLTMVGEVAMEVLIPYIMALMIDNGIKGAYGLPYTIKMGCLMILAAGIALLFGLLSAKYAAQGSMGMAATLRKRLFDKVQDFSFSNIDQFSTASLITRITTDVTNVQRAAMMLIRAGARAILMFAGALLMALRTNVQLSAVFVVVVPIIAIAVIMLASKAMPRFKEMLKRYDDLNLDVQENLTGIRVVKAFVREEYENSKFGKGADEVRATQLSAEKVVIWGMPLMFITMSMSIISVLWFGSKLLMDGQLEVGQLTSFTTYIIQVLISLMLVAMVLINLVLSRASAGRIVEVLEAKIDLKDENANSQVAMSDGSITFENVSFQYAKESRRETLSNINLTIEAGQTVGIIGGTGAGKTTLAQLIPRLYDVTGGRLLVGGKPVKDYSLQNLREDVAMVLQNNVLFSGTIKENLLWGNPKATDEQIKEACKWACAHDFIMDFPEQYETDLGRGGVNVSGGQKQRLCIARALLKAPKVVILDDSTSAVDTATDSKIRAAFKEQLEGTTTIVIAQRITSIMEADQIVVMDEGRINAVGTHAELLNSNKIYQEVYNSQQRGDEQNG